MKWIPLYDETLIWIVSLVFGALCIIQLFWVLYFFARIAFHRHKKNPNHPPVSVIIAARNEEDNLFKLLPKILEQKYPKFEVIVVNHQSLDNSSYVLKALTRVYPHLKIIELKRNEHIRNGKKLPLTVGIKGAKYENLVFTDADCEPSSKFWLKEMASQFSTKHEIVLGYGPYKKEKGFLNKIIRLDTAMIGINYLSLAKGGAAYMGVGRNLGYTKSLFLNNKGFKSHYAVQSGDDDLFIQEVAKNRNYTICLTPNAFCFSNGEKTWKDWFKQKSRHFTTTQHYRVIKKLLLGIYPLSLILFYFSFITLCVNNWLSWMTIGFFVFTILIKWFIQAMCFFKLKEKEFIWLLPIWDLMYSILSPIVYFSTEKSIAAKWK